MYTVLFSWEHKGKCDTDPCISAIQFKHLLYVTACLQRLYWESGHELLTTQLKEQSRPGLTGEFHEHRRADMQGEHLVIYLDNCSKSSAHAHILAQVREVGVAGGGGAVKWVLNFTAQEERRGTPLGWVCNGDGRGETAGNSNVCPSQRGNLGACGPRVTSTEWVCG